MPVIAVLNLNIVAVENGHQVGLPQFVGLVGGVALCVEYSDAVTAFVMQYAILTECACRSIVVVDGLVEIERRNITLACIFSVLDDVDTRNSGQ